MDPSEADWYEKSYGEVPVSGRPGRARDTLHQLMERGLGPQKSFPRVLEIGGNKGEHLPYVKHNFDQYVLTDLRAPEAQMDKRVETMAADAQHLPFADSSFDRSLVTCVLHHLPQPEQAMTELRRVTKPGGLITILLPTDPGIAYRSVRSLTTVRTARKQDLGEEVNLVHARAHHGHFWAIKLLLDKVYSGDKVTGLYWPLRVPSWNANLLTVWNVYRHADT